MGYKTLLGLFCITFLFTGCYKKSEKKAPLVYVKTAEIQQQNVPIYVDAIGQVSPIIVNVRPQITGKLLKVYVQQGAFVNKGDLLYEIDCSPYAAVLDEAFAKLAQDQALLMYAEKTVERYKRVVEDEYVSKLTYEQYQSNAEAAKAQVELDKAAIIAAQINVDYCKITAPVSGKISIYNIDVGNIVVANDPNQLTVIHPFSPIFLNFSLPQQQFEMIRKVQGDAGEWKFVASLPESPQDPVEGTTFFIDNQLDQTTGTILLKGLLPNENRQFWPGEFVKVKVLYRMADGALIVPPGAVLIGREGPYVYTVDKDNKAQAVNVSVLTRNDEFIAVDSEKLKKGDVVITEGQINVAPGVVVHR